MRPQIVTILALLLAFASNIPMSAQTSGGVGNGGNPPPPTPPPPELPLDNGLLLLLFLGLAYGCFVAFRRSKAIRN